MNYNSDNLTFPVSSPFISGKTTIKEISKELTPTEGKRVLVPKLKAEVKEEWYVNLDQKIHDNNLRDAMEILSFANSK